MLKIRIVIYQRNLWQIAFEFHPLLTFCKQLSLTADYIAFFTKFTKNPPGGHSTFFQVGVCGADLQSVADCELIVASEKRGLWTEHFQIKVLVNRKFRHLWGQGSWKFPNDGGLCPLRIWQRNWGCRFSKFPNLHKRGSWCTDSFAWNGDPCELQESREKAPYQGCTSPYPLSSVSCLRPPFKSKDNWIQSHKVLIFSFVYLCQFYSHIFLCL